MLLDSVSLMQNSEVGKSVSAFQSSALFPSMVAQGAMEGKSAGSGLGNVGPAPEWHVTWVGRFISCLYFLICKKNGSQFTGVVVKIILPSE